jgi:UDP-2,3-diacylglucosamine pyrophosphatase LpxH
VVSSSSAARDPTLLALPRLGPVTLIVSDLHLSAEPSLDDFYADDEFADFLSYHAARHEAVHLIINGDWIDFLQIDPHPDKRGERADLEEIYPLRMTEQQAVTALERTISRHTRFFDALRAFLSMAAGSRLTVLRGNHDIELAFPAVQARVRVAVGGPSPERLAFPKVAYFDPAQGLYVEHGCQYDPWNAFLRFDDPFLDRKRRKLEVPFGSVVVKTFWNRVEGEFPYVDKIRPMADSVTAILVQRPTYFLVKFDYFVDLALCAWQENLRKVFAWRPKRQPPPPPNVPEGAARARWQRYVIGKVTGLCLLVLGIQLVFQGITIFTTAAHLRAPRALGMLRELATRFVLHVGAACAIIVLARVLRFVLWKARVSGAVRSFVYRLLVLVSAAVFFEALAQMFWMPLLLAVSTYLLWDAARTIVGEPLTEKNPLARSGRDPELEGAMAVLGLPAVRTVVFGHTHGPIELELSPGKRFINSGTWVKVVDVRNARDEPMEPNTYVHVSADGTAHLMSWRGTEPARPYAERRAVRP